MRTQRTHRRSAEATLRHHIGRMSYFVFRNVAAFPAGTEFDIHFRVVEEATGAVVLTSKCYQFTISQ
ncbi:MAG TPA: hypothetical protein VIX17_07465 [Pyrinomonadaceae bacterium]